MEATITQPRVQTTEFDQTPLTGRIDYYKATMAQWAFENYPDAYVTFGFKNRGDVPLADFIAAETLQADFDAMRAQGFEQETIDMLAKETNPQGERVFTPEYIRLLGSVALPEIVVKETKDRQLEITSAGIWDKASYWETTVLSAVNERYYEAKIAKEGIDLNQLYDEGDRRLSEKIAKITAYNEKLEPGMQPIQIVDFGTRRHFSYNWHKHVLGRLIDELPEGVLLGTSNIHLAAEYGIKPIGTFAHEMPMVCAALHANTDEAMKASHSEFLTRWIERYPQLGSALTDTFGTGFFFKDFEANQDPADWQGFRHDSGDPFEFGEKTIELFEKMGVDPAEKTIVFSDGLDVDKIIDLHKRFAGRIKVVFGWGTNLTNDLGLEALSIVMKAIEAGGEGTVKLSDNPAKFTGAAANIIRYARVFDYDQAEHEFVKTVY